MTFFYSFVIDDLTVDDVYVISMNVSECLESGGACEVFANVFQDVRLPKEKCDWNSQYVIPGKYTILALVLQELF